MKPSPVLLRTRKEINRLDLEILVMLVRILRLLGKRWMLVQTNVVPEKLKVGPLLQDSTREGAMLEKLRKVASLIGFPPHMATAIFRAIIDTFLKGEIRGLQPNGEIIHCPRCGFYVNIGDPKFHSGITICPDDGLELIAYPVEPTAP